VSAGQTPRGPLRIRSLFDLPREELFISGHGLCAGCTAGTIMRMLVKVAGRDTIIVNATGCVEVSTTRYPYSNWLVPWFHSAFENRAPAPVASPGRSRCYRGRGPCLRTGR